MHPWVYMYPRLGTPVLERRASTNHGTHYTAVSFNAETSAKCQLSTAVFPNLFRLAAPYRKE